MKYLYTNGCSWTAGDEINHYDKIVTNNMRYYNTWPWFLKEKLDIPVLVNEATGGGSNKRIFRKTVNFIDRYIKSGKNPKDLMIVIGWSTEERTEKAVKNFNNDIQHVRLLIHTALDSAALDNHVTDLINQYHKIYYDLYDSDVAIEETIFYLKALRSLTDGWGITYYDFPALVFWKNNYHPVLNHLNNFHVKSFIETVNEKQWSTYQYGHPTIDTHKKWADIMFSFIKDERV
jgi:hypothetical protein